MKRWLRAGLAVLALLPMPMTAMAAFYAHTSQVLNGSTNILTIPFPYIEQNDVAVLVNGTPVPTSGLVWLSPSTIQLNTPASQLVGATVTVTRVTEIHDPAVIFQAGALNPLDLNTMSLQTLYAQQEIWDQFVSLGLDTLGGTLQHSGNTSVIATVAPGSSFVGGCAAWDANGNVYNTGIQCGGSGGSGAITPGLAGQLAVFNSAGNVVAATSVLPNGIGAITQGLGDASNLVATDNFVLNNSTAASRNLLFNGEFSSFERLPAITSTSTNIGVGIDRWHYDNSTSAPAGLTYGWDLGGIKPPVGFFGDWGFKVNTAHTMGANEGVTIRQTIEQDTFLRSGFGAVGAQNLSLSFFAQASVTGTFGGSFCNYNYPLAPTRCFTFSYTITSPNTWQNFGTVIPGDAVGSWNTGNIGGGAASIIFSLGAGTGLTSPQGTWGNSFASGVAGEVNLMATLNATWAITGVQLEVANTPTAFEHINPSIVRQLCQRYGWAARFYPVGGAASASGLTNPYVNLPTEMRAPPTLITTAAGFSPTYNFAFPGTGPVGSPGLNAVLTGTLIATVNNASANWVPSSPLVLNGYFDAEFP